MFGRKFNLKHSHGFLTKRNTGFTKKGTLFLCDAEKNTSYIIDNIFAGHILIQRLFSIGVIPGETIAVGDISAWGPVTIIAKGIKIALGRGVAAKISLKRINETVDNA